MDNLTIMDMCDDVSIEAKAMADKITGLLIKMEEQGEMEAHPRRFKLIEQAESALLTAMGMLDDASIECNKIDYDERQAYQNG